MSGSELVQVRSPGSLLTRSGRERSRDLARIEQRALTRAAMVRATALVTQVGMHEMTNLTALEGQLIRQVPLGEQRFQVLADTACTVIAAHITETRWGS